MKSLFQGALDLPPEERVAFLARECAEDHALRKRVEKLLASHDDVGSFLSSPAVVETGVITAVDEDQNGGDNDCVGRRIGPYELIRQLGHGGMGTVYLAVRADDQYKKQVAIKLVNRGMDTEMILHRFTMERQILANLEHPNIARLLEGGSSPDGLPYFVMEYIEGQPINEYCDARNFSTAKRLELFRKVCGALQYAHQNLVVHRDIKPSNILVTAEGVPKLLDFGIAKLLSPGWTEDTGEATASIVRLMTPQYASPEQLRGLAITTASDVYSLGVVLYELLSGHHPYHLNSRRLEEVIEVILHKEPEKPSLAATQRREDHRTNAETNLNPTILNPKFLRGDLDNIVLKALRKEPQRRYASVEEFSADIRRHLDGLPVTATPDTFSYRAGKFVQRNKAGVLAAAVVLITLVSATGITAWQARVARRERNKAERRFNQVRKLANAVVFKYHDQIEKLSGSTPVRESLIKDATEYLDNLSTEAGSDQSLQRELAAAYEKIGDVQGNPFGANLGNPVGALLSYRKALAIREQLFKENPADSHAKYELATGYKNIGDILWSRGENKEALSNYEKALTAFQELTNGDPTNLQFREGMVSALNGIGHVHEQAGDWRAALDSYNRMLVYSEGLLAAEPTDRTYRRGTALAYLKVGDALHDVGDDAASLKRYQDSVPILSDLASSDKNAQVTRELALAYGRISYSYEQQNQYENAIEFLQKTLTLQKTLSAADPQNVQVQLDLAVSYGNLGDNLRGLKKFDAAATEERESIRIFSEALKQDPSQSQARGNLAIGYQTLGKILAAKGDHTGAMASYRQALTIFENEPIRTAKATDLALCYEDLGDSQVAKGDFKGAKDTYKLSLDIWKELERQGKLQGADKNKPNEVSDKIAKGDVARK